MYDSMEGLRIAGAEAAATLQSDLAKLHFHIAGRNDKEVEIVAERMMQNLETVRQEHAVSRIFQEMEEFNQLKQTKEKEKENGTTQESNAD